MRLRDVPFAAVDLETTGLSPKSGARIVEVAVARVSHGRHPEVALDTLVDPEGPVLCTQIHGIRDADVVGAPLFSELAGDLIAAMDGALVGAFNASFDMGFISAEIARARPPRQFRLPPHVCLMWMRPLLSLSRRCTLSAACAQHGVPTSLHRAAGDAFACARMWEHYVNAAEAAGILTMEDLSTAGSHKYLASLGSSPYGPADLVFAGGRQSTRALKPRSEPASPDATLTSRAEHPHEVVRLYWQAVADALVDGILADTEREMLRALQQSLELHPDQIRAVHARIFADRLREYAEDDAVSPIEGTRLSALMGHLGEIGWAPGLM